MLWLHDGPGRRSPANYDRDAQALAAMGFAVAQIDYAGSSGYGLSWQNPFQGPPDEAPLADLRVVIDWIESRDLINRTRLSSAKASAAISPCARSNNSPICSAPRWRSTRRWT